MFVNIGRYSSPILVALLIVAIILSCVQTCNSVNAKKELEDYKKIAPIKEAMLQTELKHWKSKYGTVYVQYKLAEISAEDLATIHSKEVYALRQKLKEAGIREAKLKSAVVFSSVVHDTVTLSVVDTMQLDSQNRATIEFNSTDSFITYSGSIFVSVLGRDLIKEKVFFEYTYRDRYSVIYSYKSQGLFKPKLTLLTIASDNPKSTIEGVQTYTIKPDQGVFYQRGWFKFSLGVGVGAFATYMLVK